MKTQRQFLCAAWLTVCALFLLSACRGPTPIAGRVAEITATRGASNTPLPATPTASYTPTAESTATPKPADTAIPTDTSTPSPSWAVVPTRAVVTEQQTPTPKVFVSPTQSLRRVGTATATPVPPNTPTDTPNPPATATQEPDETPTPIPTPEITAPVIEGLKLVDGKYVAEKGNPYGVAVGEVVGRVSSVQVLGAPRWDGQQKKTIREFAPAPAVVITEPKVLARLTEQANTPEEIKKGNWKIALPFQPGPETRMWELTFPDYIGNQPYVVVNGLPATNEIVNPFPKTLVKQYKHTGSQSVGLWLPESIVPQKNINWGLDLGFNSAQLIATDNRGKYMEQGAVLVTNISGNVPSSWGDNVQLTLASGSKIGTKNFSLQDNVIQVRGAFVFAGSN